MTGWLSETNEIPGNLMIPPGGDPHNLAIKAE